MAVDINPEEVIQNLSAQIGSLMSENTVLKMAMGQLQAQLDAVESVNSSNGELVLDPDSDLGTEEKTK
jgi:regulator of replication initiation timing|tara:strand:+ start:5158 stop:5361 length:204 start_codon:yes stop_codon:yes gene_type:complete